MEAGIVQVYVVAITISACVKRLPAYVVNVLTQQIIVELKYMQLGISIHKDGDLNGDLNVETLPSHGQIIMIPH